jgi:hypothetical protein
MNDIAPSQHRLGAVATVCCAGYVLQWGSIAPLSGSPADFGKLNAEETDKVVSGGKFAGMERTRARAPAATAGFLAGEGRRRASFPTGGRALPTVGLSACHRYSLRF